MLLTFKCGQKYLFSSENKVTVETTQNLSMAWFQSMPFSRILRKV